jgi:hypothetical protein
MSIELQSLIQAVEKVITDLEVLEKKEDTIIPKHTIEWIQRTEQNLKEKVVSLFPKSSGIPSAIQKIDVFAGTVLLSQTDWETEKKHEQNRQSDTKNDYRIIIGHFRGIVVILKEHSPAIVKTR